MNKKDLIELIKKRWTARKFKSKPVAENDLKLILEAGRWAPSGGNKQPWELIIIKDPQLKQKIAEAYAEGLNLESLPERYLSPPILIAVCIESRITRSYPNMMPAKFIVFGSIGTMVQNMCLVATSLGLSLSWGTQPKKIQGKLRKLLKIPEYINIPDILQLGYPAQERHSTNRREIKEFTHINTMDSSKLRDL
ncbi:MAG: nitroreductase family protein [Promethearchaeia archaeon]